MLWLYTLLTFDDLKKTAARFIEADSSIRDAIIAMYGEIIDEEIVISLSIAACNFIISTRIKREELGDFLNWAHEQKLFTTGGSVRAVRSDQ